MRCDEWQGYACRHVQVSVDILVWASLKRFGALQAQLHLADWGSLVTHQIASEAIHFPEP
jgi:hypothetical protein